ncbi:MAG: polysaccharide lyase family 7 protein [bacterium]|nr:polysaccharide lyase family 7 protein [bacterium]
MFKSVLKPARKFFSHPKYYSLAVLLILVTAAFSQKLFFNTRIEADSKTSKSAAVVSNPFPIKPQEAKILSVTPTSTPTPTPSPAPQKEASSVQTINLLNWKLTLPIGSSGHPTEIKQPTLSSYIMDPWFLPSGGGLRFRAPVNGVTTSGSKYPRSELREMTGGGAENASWSSTTGTHTMFLDEAITAVPQTKKHVVAGQIHDADDDVVVIRLEYPNLYVNVNGSNVFTIDSNYTLGKRFNVKFEVGSGKTKVYYNGGSSSVYILDKSYSGAYFKTGAYTQSNCSKEGSSLCSDGNFGEVVVYQAAVTHQ